MPKFIIQAVLLPRSHWLMVLEVMQNLEKANRFLFKILKLAFSGNAQEKR